MHKVKMSWVKIRFQRLLLCARATTRHPNRFSMPVFHASGQSGSDRSQNTRTEALNLIRNRKGKTPHIACVTAEPMPNRLASLAMGTGDIDCVYHMALMELASSVKESGNEDQQDMPDTLTTGKRLRDISDLPFDLVS